MTQPNSLQLLTDLVASDARNSEATALLLREFLRRFAQSSEKERDEMRAVLTEPEARKIASLSLVAAEQALADRDPSWLDWSLWAHDLEQFRQDPRDNMRLLPATEYAAKELGLDGPALFLRVAEQVSAPSAKQLRAWAARPPGLRALKVMGLRAVESGGRVRFEFD